MKQKMKRVLCIVMCICSILCNNQLVSASSTKNIMYYQRQEWRITKNGKNCYKSYAKKYKELYRAKISGSKIIVTLKGNKKDI